MDRQLFKDRVFLAIAHDLAGLGTCERAHVGAIITRGGRCISWGYNGAPPGMPHCEHSPIDHTSCRIATHAEANALAFAARQGISTAGSTLYVTLSPCDACARLLVAAGIVRVVATERYKDFSGEVLLQAANIEVDFYLPLGG